MSNITTQLLNFIKDEIKQDEVDLIIDTDTELLISGILDSLGVMQLVTFIANEFSLSVPPGDITIENFNSINTISHYIQSSVKA